MGDEAHALWSPDWPPALQEIPLQARMGAGAEGERLAQVVGVTGQCAAPPRERRGIRKRTDICIIDE